MKAVDLLLNKNNKDAQIEIERLSEKFGQPFMISIRPIDLSLIDESLENFEKIYKTIELGLVDDLNNEELFNQYNVSTFEDLLNQIFLVGELRHIAKEITLLSSLTTEDMDEMKQDIFYQDARWLWKRKYITAPSEYFKLNLVDKQILNDWINETIKEDEKDLKELVKSIKDSKTAESVQAQLLFKILQENKGIN